MLHRTAKRSLRIHFSALVLRPACNRYINICNKNQQNARFFNINVFNLITVPSTCFEHPSIHPQEDLYMQFYGIYFMRPYKRSGRWQCRRPDRLYGRMK